MSSVYEPQAEPEDRREAERTETTSLLMSPVTGTIKNISSSGIGVETWDPFKVHSEFVATIGQVGKQARLACRVEWCRLVRTEKTHDGTVISIYRSGLSFLGSDKLKDLAGVG